MEIVNEKDSLAQGWFDVFDLFAWLVCNSNTWYKGNNRVRPKELCEDSWKM